MYVCSLHRCQILFCLYECNSKQIQPRQMEGLTSLTFVNTPNRPFKGLNGIFQPTFSRYGKSWIPTLLFTPSSCKQTEIAWTFNNEWYLFTRLMPRTLWIDSYSLLFSAIHRKQNAIKKKGSLSHVKQPKWFCCLSWSWVTIGSFFVFFLPKKGFDSFLFQGESQKSRFAILRHVCCSEEKRASWNVWSNARKYRISKCS